MTRVLITGGTGFVGPYLVDLLRADASTITVAASDVPLKAPLTGVSYERVDIRHSDQVNDILHAVKPTEIYHLAAISSVEDCTRDPRAAFEINVVGTYNIIEAAMNLPVPSRILNVSTSQVYASSEDPLSESSRVNPNNAYAATKAMAELVGMQLVQSTRGGVVTARAFNHTGPGQSEHFVVSSIAKQFAEIRAGLRPEILELGNTSVARDFADVRDIVRAYVALLRKGHVGEVYNVCSGKAVPLLQLIQLFEAISGVKVKVSSKPAKMRRSDVERIVGDPSKIRTEVGWCPWISLEETLRDLLDHWAQKISRERPIEV